MNDLKAEAKRLLSRRELNKLDEAQMEPVWGRHHRQAPPLATLLRLLQVMVAAAETDPKMARRWGAEFVDDVVEVLLTFAEPPHGRPASWLAPVNLDNRRPHKRIAMQYVRALSALGDAWSPDAPWAVDYLMSLTSGVRANQTLLEFKTVATLLRKPLAALAGPTPLDPQLHARMMRHLPSAVVRTIDLAGMRILAHEATPLMDELGQAQAQVRQLMLMHRFDQTDNFNAAMPLMDKVVALHPNVPRIQWLRAQLIFDTGDYTVADLEPLFEHLPRDQPDYAAAIRWLARVLFYMGSAEADRRSLHWYQVAASAEPLPKEDALRQTQLTVKLDPTNPDARAANEEPLRMPAEDFLGWSEVLRPLADLVNLPLLHDSEPDVPELERRATAALAHLADPDGGLASLPDVSVQTVMSAGRAIVAAMRRSLERTADLPASMTQPHTPAYGLMDPARCRVVCDAVDEHAIWMCRYTLDPKRLLADTSGPRPLLELVELLVERLCAHGRVDEALQDLAAVRSHLGALGGAYFAKLEEQCHLTRADTRLAAACGADWAGSAEGREVVALRFWDDWVARSGATPRTLVQNVAITAPLEAVRSDGVLHRFAHTLAPVRVQAVRVQGLVLRNSYAAITRQGDMLRPNPWHLTMGDFPWRHRSVYNWAAQGAALARPASVRDVAEPVAVLGNMDATWHGNYYHWMVLLLPRILWLLHSGTLLSRRVMLPAELSGWMNASLEAIGLPEERVIRYASDEVLRCADALVLEPLDFASASLVRALSAHLLVRAEAAGIPRNTTQPRLFVSRKEAGARPLMDEDLIMARAQRAGFEVVQPETLPLLEQVQLFAGARALAAPPGAALTNLMFAPRGARMLSIFKEEECLPVFADLTHIRGQHYRWLLGKTDARFKGGATIVSPYHVPMALVERELDWAAGGSA